MNCILVPFEFHGYQILLCVCVSRRATFALTCRPGAVIISMLRLEWMEQTL